MSLFESLVSAIIKADKELITKEAEVEIKTPPQETREPPKETKETKEINTNELALELEKFRTLNAQLEERLKQSQKANFELLNKTPVNDTQSVSEILRSQEFHPLYERK